jgi:hypothetical protein
MVKFYFLRFDGLCTLYADYKVIVIEAKDEKHLNQRIRSENEIIEELIPIYTGDCNVVDKRCYKNYAFNKCKCKYLYTKFNDLIEPRLINSVSQKSDFIEHCIKQYLRNFDPVKFIVYGGNSDYFVKFEGSEGNINEKIKGKEVYKLFKLV